MANQMRMTFVRDFKGNDEPYDQIYQNERDAVFAAQVLVGYAQHIDMEDNWVVMFYRKQGTEWVEVGQDEVDKLLAKNVSIDQLSRDDMAGILQESVDAGDISDDDKEETLRELYDNN